MKFSNDLIIIIFILIFILSFIISAIFLKFEPSIGDVKKEKELNLNILKKVVGKKGDIVNVRKVKNKNDFFFSNKYTLQIIN